MNEKLTGQTSAHPAMVVAAEAGVSTAEAQGRPEEELAAYDWLNTLPARWETGSGWGILKAAFEAGYRAHRNTPSFSYRYRADVDSLTKKSSFNFIPDVTP
jgi:hypothetical protein